MITPNQLRHRGMSIGAAASAPPLPLGTRIADYFGHTGTIRTASPGTDFSGNPTTLYDVMMDGDTTVTSMDAGSIKGVLLGSPPGAPVGPYNSSAIAAAANQSPSAPPSTSSMTDAFAMGSTAMTVWSVLGIASVAASAYHGYKRNNSVGWAVGWGLLGGLFPVITPAVALAQGYGKRHK